MSAKLNVLPVKLAGDAVLYQPTMDLRKEEILTPRIQELIKRLFYTARRKGFAGLAANQVGEPIRLFVLYYPRYPTIPEFSNGIRRVIINPIVHSMSIQTSTDRFEGCGSLPGVRGLPQRSEQIDISFLDEAGNECREVISGHVAVIVQHEIDHLDGVLFVERADPRSLISEVTYRKWVPNWDTRKKENREP